MKKFRKKLENQKRMLLKRLGKEPQKTVIQRRHSRFPRRFNQKLRQTLLSARADQQMKDVVDAIERLDDGVFGKCVVCGEKIEPNRLEALPTATHCWSCQQDKP
jgi:RNA polymerase-binding transcription factor DksA